MTQVEINDSNFHEYFFDARKNTPQDGQILVVYEAIAFLKNGTDKQRLIDLISTNDSAISASQMMKNALHATERDSVRVLIEIINDLLSGMRVDKVLKKPYKYKIEIFFYTWPEYVPNDPHWRSVSLLRLDKAKKSQEEIENMFKDLEIQKVNQNAFKEIVEVRQEV